MLYLGGLSGIVDRRFKGEELGKRSVSDADFPEEVLKLLEALDATRAPGWLSAESLSVTWEKKAGII